MSLNTARDGRGKALRMRDMFELAQRVLRVPPCFQDLLTMILRDNLGCNEATLALAKGSTCLGRCKLDPMAGEESSRL